MDGSKLPFTYGRKTYQDCTTDISPMGCRDRKWRAFTTDLVSHLGVLGFCLHKEEEELVPREIQTVAGPTCVND